jgi:protein MPE1
MRYPRPGTGPRPFRPMPEELPARTPPPGYVCFRCGDKGHYISHCPTIGNSEFDNRPRIKRTTGIPKMFLKTVEDKSQVNGGLMITQDGEFVVAQPNE